MTAKEVANIYIMLRRKGWNDTEIGDFIVFLETHNPTAEEAEEAKKNQK
ncbi:MAG: hypothetical protein IKQ71_04375 [Lachnospiraceae bacterium]|nr:hypothetical protein [Lachnospiraceae bacterium]